MVKTTKYTYIDSLRGYAVLMVLACHVYALGGGQRNPEVTIWRFWFECRNGVMLFYMISALTLFLSYGRKMSLECHPVTNFFIRRFFRIVPLFYLVCLYVISFGKFNPTEHITPTELIGSLTFTNGVMPKYIHGIVFGGWSIAVETTFYLFVPVLFKHINNIQKAVAFFVFSIGLSLLLRYAAFNFLAPYYKSDLILTWTTFWLPVQLPVFALGIFLYFLIFKSDLNLDVRPAWYRQLSNILIFLSIYFFLIASYSDRLFISENIGFSFIIILFIIGFALYPATRLNNYFVQFIGKISYSFYLFHPIVISLIGVQFLNKIGGIINPTFGFLLCFVVILSVTSIASYISYKVIEQPFQKLGTAIINRIEAREVAPKYI